MVEKDSGLYVPAYFGRFLDSLASEVENLILFSHLPEEVDFNRNEYRLKEANIQVVYLPKKGSFPHQLLVQRQVQKIFKKNAEKFDVLLMRGPTPLMPAIGEALSDKPKALLMVGDYLSGFDSIEQPAWRKFLIKCYWQYIYRRIFKICESSLVIPNSEKLREQFEKSAEKIVMTHTTSLTENDLFKRSDTCQNQQIKLLYTGRVVAEKGLINVLTALEKLRSDGFELSFQVIGWSDQKDDFLKLFLKEIDQKKLNQYVSVVGYQPIEELNEVYNRADIFVNASTSDFEGFPRTIWEAMAHSLPVVATGVGSIPEYIGDFVNLVPPKNADLLADAIQEVIVNGEYRREIIEKGFQLASDVTLEKQTGAMVKEIENYAKR